MSTLFGKVICRYVVIIFYYVGIQTKQADLHGVSSTHCRKEIRYTFTNQTNVG